MARIMLCSAANDDGEILMRATFVTRLRTPRVRGTLIAAVLGSASLWSAPGGCAAETHPEVPIWPGVAPGSEHATQREVIGPALLGKFIAVRNVVRPTLTVYRASQDLADAAVIIAPGGAFRFLNFDTEGTQVAEWFAAHGVTAFVLKYRLVETPANDAVMWPAFVVTMANTKALFAGLEEDGKFGVADGIQALRVVRAHAKEWGVPEHRIGFVGFSAGAAVASGALLKAAPADRPDFAAPIYGAPFGEIGKLDPSLPPVFMAYAGDDQLVPHFVDSFYDALRSAGLYPEIHIYDHGGHGFGMRHQGTSSDHWIDDLFNWMVAHQFARAQQL
jgi:acetyl esterase/lipase